MVGARIASHMVSIEAAKINAGIEAPKRHNWQFAAKLRQNLRPTTCAPFSLFKAQPDLLSDPKLCCPLCAVLRRSAGASRPLASA